jgi:hypothetical protein
LLRHLIGENLLKLPDSVAVYDRFISQFNDT